MHSIKWLRNGRMPAVLKMTAEVNEWYSSNKIITAEN